MCDRTTGAASAFGSNHKMIFVFALTSSKLDAGHESPLPDGLQNALFYGVVDSRELLLREAARDTNACLKHRNTIDAWSKATQEAIVVFTHEEWADSKYRTGLCFQVALRSIRNSRERCASGRRPPSTRKYEDGHTHNLPMLYLKTPYLELKTYSSLRQRPFSSRDTRQADTGHKAMTGVSVR